MLESSGVAHEVLARFSLRHERSSFVLKNFRAYVVHRRYMVKATLLFIVPRPKIILWLVHWHDDLFIIPGWFGPKANLRLQVPLCLEHCEYWIA